LGETLRNDRAVDAQIAQHRLEGLMCDERAIRIVAAQVHVELAVGKAIDDPMRPVHGQCGLAHPGGAGQCHDTDPRRPLEQVVELDQLIGTPMKPATSPGSARGTLGWADTAGVGLVPLAASHS